MGARTVGGVSTPGNFAAGRRMFNTLVFRGRHLALFDVVAASLSFLVSLALRFDAPSSDFTRFLNAYWWVIPVLVVTRIGALIFFRMYQRVWRYASIDELVTVVEAVLVSSLIAYAAVFAVVTLDPKYNSLGFPRTVAMIDSFLFIAIAGGWRFAFRTLGVLRAGAAAHNGQRAVIVGDSTAALATLRELRSHPETGVTPVGILADDLPQGSRVMNVAVLGAPADLTNIAAASKASIAVFTTPTARGRELRKLVRKAEAAGLRCLTIPSVAEVIAGRVRTTALREVQIEDLLRRAPARIDLETVATAIRGKTVLITGAGGSIGGEIARQIHSFGPTHLYLLGRGENSLFETLQTLPRDGSVLVEPVVLDTREGERLDAFFAKVRPDAVFHAAAHKHVALMERFPEEAVAVNILGTLNVLSSAARHGSERAVLISTDKAVNPTSVMGATKRFAELMTRAVAERQSGTRFAIVRFGNVLRSRGSVVTLFERQIASGGPITVTEPDATRYFMTIPEAVQLVLQASVLAEPGGDTFVLDMGEPVRIGQLVEDLVQLHGLELEEDIDLEVIGLRPGEKLSEELFFADEQAIPTEHEAIRRIVKPAGATSSDVGPAIEELRRFAAAGDQTAILRVLRKVIPEYAPPAAPSLTVGHQ